MARGRAPTIAGQAEHPQHQDSAEHRLAQLQEQAAIAGVSTPPIAIGHGQDRGIDGGLLRGGPVGPQEPDREPAAGQQVGGDLAVLVSAARDPVALEDQHRRDPNGDRQQNQPGSPRSQLLEHKRNPLQPMARPPWADRGPASGLILEKGRQRVNLDRRRGRPRRFPARGSADRGVSPESHDGLRHETMEL